MPELPDVQVYKEYVDATSLHRRITGVDSDAADLRESVSPRTFRRHLDGHEIRGTRRHGKHLFLDVTGGGGWLRMHFGMTGALDYARKEPAPDHARLVLEFADDDRLAYVNQRKFGELGFVDDVDDFVESQDLGPDAMDLDQEGFVERLEGRRGGIKSALMNQSTIAGLGNVYVDEILFHAGLHPESPVSDLDEDALAGLYRAMRHDLEKAIEARADSDRMPDSWLIHRREEGATCPSCGHEIEKTRVSGRSTYLCPHEQPKPGGS